MLETHRGNSPAILLLDRHSVHKSLAPLKKLAAVGIETLLLPAHMTHVLQPLDDVPFAVFKRAVCQKKTQLTNSLVLRRESTAGVVPIAFMETFTEDVIKAGFKNTGVWPFDKKRINSRAELALPKKEKVESSSSSLSLIEKVEQLANVVLELDKPLNESSPGRIPKTNKLFTGEELIKFYEEQEQTTKEAKVQRRKGKGNKRKRGADDIEEEPPENNSKKAKVSDANEPASKICVLCSPCPRPPPAVWTCPTCNMFSLCDLHCADTFAIEIHRGSCEEIED